jgi:hypothetical protein
MTRCVDEHEALIAEAGGAARIFGRGCKFEDLLSVFFRHAIADADGQLTERGGRVVR